MEDVKFFVEGIKMRYIKFVYVSYFYWIWVDNVFEQNNVCVLSSYLRDQF